MRFGSNPQAHLPIILRWAQQAKVNQDSVLVDPWGFRSNSAQPRDPPQLALHRIMVGRTAGCDVLV